MALMKSISGIRGIFGTDLHPENLAQFSAAFGHWLNGGTVVIGRDSRVTGPICRDVVTATLRSVGCDVIDVGLVPTPTVAMTVLKHQADGAIILSASHNPAEWNALKLLNSKSEFLDDTQGKEVLAIAENRNYTYRSYDNTGTLTQDTDALSYHIDQILNLPYINPEQIKKAGFSVAVDAVNGAGSEAIPVFLEALGVSNIHKLNCEPNGLFPHNPEPLPEHLTEICDFVKEHQSDLGIATDPDADRLALVTDEGRLFGEEYTQAMAFDYILGQKEGDCCTNLSSSRIVEDVAKKHGRICHRSAVGEINVVKKMQETNAVIGGEGNGGVIAPDLHYGRDALVGTAMMLQLMAERGISSSEYRGQLTDYYISKNKIDLTNIDADQVLKSALDHYQAYPLNTTDGVKIDFDEGWVHLRKSNTEPIIRVYSESTTEEKANKLAQQVMDAI